MTDLNLDEFGLMSNDLQNFMHDGTQDIMSFLKNGNVAEATQQLTSIQQQMTSCQQENIELKTQNQELQSKNFAL